MDSWGIGVFGGYQGKSGWHWVYIAASGDKRGACMIQAGQKRCMRRGIGDTEDI